MKLLQINAKIGVLPKGARTKLDTILNRMKEGRKYSRSNSKFSDSRIVRCELIGQDAKLINDEFFPNGKTDIIIKNREYTIDNKSGEVTLKINPLKYIFISSQKALKTVGNLIETIKNNFDNSEKVQQCRLVVEGFSKKRLEQLQKNIEKYQKSQLKEF